MRTSFALAAALCLVACGSTTTETHGTTTTAAGGAATTGAGGSASGGAGGAVVGPHTEPLPQFVPKATGACPGFTQGKNTFTADGISRDALVWIDPAKAAELDGPLVFFWHGAGGNPSEASYALGSALGEITSMGGVVVAPYHDPASSILPWYLCLGGTDETDLRIADEVLACAIQTIGVDMRRIHSVGFSAGAMNTEQFAARRSGYLASVVAYSGARLGVVEEQDPSNKYPAMLLHGGPNDMVVVNFEDAQEKYHDDLTAEGHFSFLCNHGKGHTVPADARASAWQFLQDHPFGATPEPYAGGLPAGFPSYCSL
jgi:predicted esterase